MMDDQKVKILELLYNIQKRPGMYITGYPNYDKLEYFINGFFYCLDYKRLRKAAYHFGEKYGMGSAISFAQMLCLKYPDSSEEERCSLYLSLLIEFFESEEGDQ